MNDTTQTVNTVGTLILVLAPLSPEKMAPLDVTSTLQPLAGLSVDLVLVSLAFGIGAVGSFLGLFGDDDDDESGSSGGDGDDVFGGGGDGFDDMGGLDDTGGLDDMGGLGDMGGLDDMGGGTDGGGGSEELEHRVDELESELGEVSSTVSTVRSENEQISETVGDVEENVRKLLDIYEMVTRGVNPFVDDASGSPFEGGGGGGLGLFESDDGGGGGQQEIDEDLASADAEEFFDDGFGDLDDDDGFADDDFATDDGFADGAAATAGAGDNGSDGDDGDGMSFEELKQEYDQGAEWANDDGTDAAEEVSEPAAEEGPDVVVDEPTGAPHGDAPPDTGAGDAPGFGAETDPEPEPPSEPEPTPSEPVAEKPAAAAGPIVDEGARPTPRSRRDRARRKPYLSHLPGEYTTDLAVMEWLSYLVRESDGPDAHRAIAYYGTVGWISESVEEELHAYLRGIAGDGADGPAPTAGGSGMAANGFGPAGTSAEADDTDDEEGSPGADLDGLAEADAPTDAAFESVGGTNGEPTDDGTPPAEAPADAVAVTDYRPVPVGLTVEHHTESLRQIARIAGDPEGELLETYEPSRPG